MKKLPKSQVEFELIVSWDEWKKYLDAAAEEASKEIKIAGFRPGKAPRNLVEQKVGKEIIINGAAERAVKKSYVDFVTGENLEVLGSPKVELLEAEEGKDLKYKATVSVMPELKMKVAYPADIKKINEEFSQKSTKAEDKDLELELEKLANSRVKLVTVRRAAQKGDSVEVDFTVLRDGVPIENGTSKNHPLILGRGVFIPGFEDNVIGMSEGEEKEFELKFPDDYHEKSLAGQPATFKVKMDLVQERQTPAVDDNFASSLGKFENLEALKLSVREGMEHENEHRVKDERRAKYMEALVKNAEVELPDILVKEEAERMLAEFEYQLTPMGMTLDQYLAQLKKDRKDLEKDWEPEAAKRVIGAMALKVVAKECGLEATSKETQGEMNKTLAYYKDVKDIEKNIDMERLYNYSKGIVENEKVFEYLEKL
jgi:trigger factor